MTWIPEDPCLGKVFFFGSGKIQSAEIWQHSKEENKNRKVVKC